VDHLSSVANATKLMVQHVPEKTISRAGVTTWEEIQIDSVFTEVNGPVEMPHRPLTFAQILSMARVDALLI